MPLLGRLIDLVNAQSLALAAVVAMMGIAQGNAGEGIESSFEQGVSSVSACMDRCRLAHRCVSVEPNYIGEVFSNTRGGLATSGATRYQALLEIPLTIDLEQMPAALPGTVYLLGQNTHGRGLTEDFVGDSQVLSNIDSFQNIAQVSEYWWEFELLNENVTVRVGKQDVNTEFLYIDTAADFIQSTFGLSPSTAFPTYPDPSMGIVVLARLSESWQLKTGLWDAFADGGSWGVSGNDTILLVGEVEHSYALADGKLPGVVAIGAVYESAGQIEGVPISAVQEYYVQLEQWVIMKDSRVDDVVQGLGLFAGYYPRIPGRFITADSVGDSFVAGAIYTGLLPTRDQDVVGMGVAWTELFAGGSGEETAYEIFYKAQLTPRICVQPDLQYIATPSGINNDALVAGVRFQLAL